MHFIERIGRADLASTPNAHYIVRCEKLYSLSYQVGKVLVNADYYVWVFPETVLVSRWV